MSETRNSSQLQQPFEPNPALKDLAVFLGKWDLEVSRASFLPDQTATIHAPAAFEWVENGSFLILRQGDQSSPPSAIWLIGRDDSVETYTVLYFDDRGVSRVYEMSFQDGVWKIWRQAPGFHQRFTGILSEDGQTISGEWENSSNGETWEHDFDLTYRKVG